MSPQVPVPYDRTEHAFDIRSFVIPPPPPLDVQMSVHLGLALASCQQCFEAITLLCHAANQNFNGQDTLTIDVTDNQPQNPNMPTMYVGILVEGSCLLQCLRKGCDGDAFLPFSDLNPAFSPTQPQHICTPIPILMHGSISAQILIPSSLCIPIPSVRGHVVRG